MTRTNHCRIGSVSFGTGQLSLIAGPCVAESLELCLEIADTLGRLCADLGIGYVFKASFDKANRSSGGAYRGPGLETGLKWLAEVAKSADVAILSDVHEVDQVAAAGEILDCLQIPAFLCRQSDLLTAAGRTGRAVNIKKGQFMAPWDMGGAVEKVRSTGNNHVLLTERGTTFGYNRLITDFRGITEMRKFAPVVFDATHSVQKPGALGGASGGRREYAPLLAGAAMAAGADALFIETHTDPGSAKSDAASQIPLEQMPAVLNRCLAVFGAARDNPI